MILEEETYNKFGYYSKELSHGSNKKIIIRCDKCGKIRESTKHNYHNLCISCAQKGKHLSEEHKQKLSESQKGKHCTQEAKQKIRDAKIGKHRSEETKQKLRDANIGKQLSKEHKQKISDGVRGENHPNWQGGLSFEPYCILFNDDFRERVREYWNRRCVVCEKTEKEQMDEMKYNGKRASRLAVHHVTQNKDTCCDETIPLFVPLCTKHHREVHSNFEYWEIEFKRIIYSKNIDGKCFYSKKEMNDMYREFKR